MKDAALVLEGGATRGVFTTGVLDCLMDKDMYLAHVIGVSMGACNAISYVSGQRGRTRDCLIHQEKEYDFYYGWKDIVKERSIMNMDMLFDKYPKEYFPFDFDTYFASEIECELVTTNCLTGKAEYMTEREDEERLMQIARASSSMPFASSMLMIDDVPYLDGGIADSIPVFRAVELGYKKIVVVLTRGAGYRKKVPTKASAAMCRRMYKDYPKAAHAIILRNQMYNRTLNMLESLERKGSIFVIRPQMTTISRVEKDYQKLMNFYQHGYDTMEREYENLLKYLDE